jgi:hypothetical protein
LRPPTRTLSNMRVEAILILVSSTVVVPTGLLILLRRHAAHRNFNRVIARFERDLASPWPPAPHEPSAAERAAVRKDKP